MFPYEQDITTMESKTSMRSLRNPYIAGPPVVNPKMFFGRQQILNRIVDLLHNNHFMINGPRRIGKTSLLYQLKNQLINLNDPDYHFIPVFINLQGIPECDFFYTTMEDIINSTSEFLSTKEVSLDFYQTVSSEYNDRTFGRDLGKIIGILQQQSAKTIKLVLLIDEMDVMNTYNQQIQSQFRSIFQKDFARNLGAVVVGVNLFQQWQRYDSPFYNMFDPLTLEPLLPEEARQLILTPVEEVYNYDEQAITRILEVTERHPFRLQ